MKVTLYTQAINDDIDLDTRYKLARRLSVISKYERMNGMMTTELPELDEEQLYYLEHHESILPKPLLAERLGIKPKQLEIILNHRREARLIAQSQRWEMVIA